MKRSCICSLIAGLSAVALLGAGCGNPSPGFPLGEYVTTIEREELAAALGPGSDPLPTAEWELRFGEGGAYAVRTGGETVVEGTHAVEGNRLTIDNERGPLACEGLGPAVFEWSTVPEGLVLSPSATDAPAVRSS